MYAYCGNNPVNREDILGYCYYNANGEWRHDNWEYIGGYERQPDPGYYQGTTESGKDIYIAKDTNYSTPPDSVKIVDKRDTNINPKTNQPDPDFLVMDSYKITDEHNQNQILDAIVNYNTNNPLENYEWNRTRTSLLKEWKIHNRAYEWMIKRDHTADCDFNNDDEGKGWLAFIWDSVTK